MVPKEALASAKTHIGAAILFDAPSPRISDHIGRLTRPVSLFAIGSLMDNA